jgi:hypothetical protein
MLMIRKKNYIIFMMNIHDRLVMIMVSSFSGKYKWFLLSGTRKQWKIYIIRKYDEKYKIYLCKGK